MTTERSWRPDPRRLAVAGSGGVTALVAGVVLRWPALFALAAGLLWAAGRDLWFQTPLSADADGIHVRHGPGRVESLSWGRLERIEARRASHRGLVTIVDLELDTGDRLVLLSRYRLGHEPAEVAADLRLMRPGPPPR